MRWGKAAAVGGAALGAAALYNVAAGTAAPLDNALGGESGELLWRTHRIAYTRHGAGTPVVLIHGIYAGASSLEWRHTVSALAERHTVFAIDLIGFGRSARPNLRYTSSLLQAMIADAVTRLVHGPCAIVASSLSAAHVIALAARDPRRIAALALIAPTGVQLLRDPPTTAQAAAQLMLETPLVGTTFYNGLTSPISIRRFLELSYFNDRLVTDELVAGHIRSARQPGAKYAVAAFVGGKLNVDVRAALRRLRVPLLLMWGEQGRMNAVQHAHAFRVLTPAADWLLVPGAGDLPHDEQPTRVNAALLRFLSRSIGATVPRPAEASPAATSSRASA